MTAIVTWPPGDAGASCASSPPVPKAAVMIRPAATTALIAALTLALPARAAKGLMVWNDPQAMAVKLATLDAANPAQITSIRVLVPLQSISVTMTAVASDGSAIAVCHEVQDGNEGQLYLLGFSPEGRMSWSLHIGDLTDQLTALIGPQGGPQPGHLFFYSCANGGATGAPGVVAFDIGLYRTQTNDQVTARIHMDARQGRLIAAELRAPGTASGLPLGRNPMIHRAAPGAVSVMDPTAGFGFPTGDGVVLWGTTPLRHKGEAAVRGHDFAWWLAPKP